jgi:hypothetical protein
VRLGLRNCVTALRLLCYNLPMTKPPTSVRSIRLPDTEWARLQGRADALGVSLNALVAKLIEPVIHANPPARGTVREVYRSSDDGGPPLSRPIVPTLERKAFNPQPKSGKR